MVDSVRFAIVTVVAAVLLVPAAAQAASPNDNIASAQVVTSGSALVENSTATTQASEVLTCDGANYDRTVWYKFTAPSGGTFTATTAGSSTNTVLVVYADPGGGAIPTSVLQCNNDDPLNPGSLQSRKSFAALAGNVFYIQVGTVVAQSAGNIQLMIGEPANNNRTNAETLTAGTSGVRSNFLADTEQSEDTVCAQPGGAPDQVTLGSTVWFRYTPTLSGQATFLASEPAGEPDFDTVLQTYAPGVTDPSSSQCDDDVSQTGSIDRSSTVTIPVTAGQTYFVQVGTYAGPPPGTPMSPEGRFQITTTFLDNVAPDTSITSGVAAGGRTNDTTPSFGFTSTEPTGATFQCRVFPTAAPPAAETGWAACTTPHSTATLAAGDHTFQVRAIDVAANKDGSPASREFTVDTTPPDTSIISGVAAGGRTNDTTPAFGFSATEPTGATFQCALHVTGQAAVFAACASPFTQPSVLAQGAYTFEVRALDVAGNVDGSPATRAFTIDTAPPTTTIGTSPPAQTNDTTPTWDFTTDEPAGATFQCRTYATGDASPPGFAACSGPGATHTPTLTDGSWVFEVRAVDAAGNADASPETDTVLVDTGPPDTSFGSGPNGLTNTASPVFEFTSNESGATFECKLDAAADFTACTSPLTLADLAQGEHTLQVRAKDRAGTLDDSPASRAFVVDTVGPETTISSAPGAVTEDTTPAFVFASSEAGSTFTCKIDGGEPTVCASPNTTTALPLGQHTFTVFATDPAGNVDATPATVTFRVEDFDRDRDGSRRDGTPKDCNDADPSTRPGAVDKPGNMLDEDCSGADATFPVITSSISTRWVASKRSTRMAKMVVSDVPVGGVVVIKCLVKGCPFKTKTFTPKKGLVTIHPRFRKSKLKPGKVEVHVLAPQQVGKIIVYTLRRAALPTSKKLCLAVGASKPAVKC